VRRDRGGAEPCRLKDANSSEFNLQTPHPVIYLIEQWFDHRTKTTQKRDLASDKGGSMRLGAYPCKLEKGPSP